MICHDAYCERGEYITHYMPFVPEILLNVMIDCVIFHIIIHDIMHYSHYKWTVSKTRNTDIYMLMGVNSC